MGLRQNKKVVVVGLGYVGLPLAVLAREKGWQAVGIDIDEKKVELINQGKVPFKDSELAERLRQWPIVARVDFAAVSAAEVVIIAVPTPVSQTNVPDLSPLVLAIKKMKQYLWSGQTVVIESTINPGVMDEVIRPLIDKVGVHLVHCPERVNPGDLKWSTRNIPRVLGAYTDEGAGKALAFYNSVLEAPVKVMKTPREAEAVKILENTFRDINIAYINEMARSFAVLGIDITRVIEGAATKPFAFMPHYPGNGVGGHCISVDPYYMIERARQAGFNHQFLKLARRINDGMPAYTVELLVQAARRAGIAPLDIKVALLGLAYKKDVADKRNSPAIKTRELLRQAGIETVTFDPYLPAESSVTSLELALARANAVMLACDHCQLVRSLTASKLAVSGVKVVIDGKNVLDMDGLTKAGLIYSGIGRRG